MPICDTMKATKVSSPKSRQRLNLSPNLAPLASDVIALRVCVCSRTAGSGLVCGTELVFRSALTEEKDLAVMQVLVLLVSDSDGHL